MTLSELVLHENPISGNCYKIRLVAAHLGLPLERRAYDTKIGETRTEAFLSTVDANGRVPVLQIGADRFLPESNAACLYLADGLALIPEDRFDRADMLRWMFWEQYSHEPNVATLRWWLAFVGEDNLSAGQIAAIPGKRTAGEEALDLMERHLRTRAFFVGEAFSLADVALYAYTHVAGDGRFDLARWPAIGAWLGRVAALPGHVRIGD